MSQCPTSQHHTISTTIPIIIILSIHCFYYYIWCMITELPSTSYWPHAYLRFLPTPRPSICVMVVRGLLVLLLLLLILQFLLSWFEFRDLTFGTCANLKSLPKPNPIIISIHKSNCDVFQILPFTYLAVEILVAISHKLVLPRFQRSQRHARRRRPRGLFLRANADESIPRGALPWVTGIRSCPRPGHHRLCVGRAGQRVQTHTLQNHTRQTAGETDPFVSSLPRPLPSSYPSPLLIFCARHCSRHCHPLV